MRTKFQLYLASLLLAALPALAQFEGVLEMKLTTTDKEGNNLGGGTMNISLGKAGARSELNMQHGAMGIKMVMLQKSDTPDKTYHINDAARTYTEIDLAKLKAMASQHPDETPYTVEKLGQEKLLGYNTQHVLVKQKDPAAADVSATEMWTAKDFGDYESFSRLQVRHGRMPGQAGLVKALKDAGAEGMPLKSISSNPDGSKTTMEVVKAEKKALPASTFEIPPGYTKSEGGMMDMMGGMTGAQGEAARKQMEDAKKKMDEALKNMTPEQRQMFEKMMKQHAPQP